MLTWKRKIDRPYISARKIYIYLLKYNQLNDTADCTDRGGTLPVSAQPWRYKKVQLDETPTHLFSTLFIPTAYNPGLGKEIYRKDDGDAQVRDILASSHPNFGVYHY